jgi:hypothetical protein
VKSAEYCTAILPGRIDIAIGLIVLADAAAGVVIQFRASASREDGAGND